MYQFDDGASARSLISRFFKICGTLRLVAPDVFIVVVGYVVSGIVEIDVVAPIVVSVVISGVVVVEVAVVVVVVVVGLRGSHPDI